MRFVLVLCTGGEGLALGVLLSVESQKSVGMELVKSSWVSLWLEGGERLDSCAIVMGEQSCTWESGFWVLPVVG